MRPGSIWRRKLARSAATRPPQMFQRAFGALAINLLLVIYLVWSKRLFGVRGGKKAYEAMLRSESVIEVEQAALAAASLLESGQPGQHGHGKPASAAVQPPGDVPNSA